MSSESFRPSWGRRFHQETVHHPLDFRVEKLAGGGYEVKIMGGGFIAYDFDDMIEKLVSKKHLSPEIILELTSSLRSDDLVWQMPLRQDQVLGV